MRESKLSKKPIMTQATARRNSCKNTMPKDYELEVMKEIEALIIRRRQIKHRYNIFKGRIHGE